MIILYPNISLKPGMVGVSNVNETQILQAKCGDICKLNYPSSETRRDLICPCPPILPKLHFVLRFQENNFNTGESQVVGEYGNF